MNKIKKLACMGLIFLTGIVASGCDREETLIEEAEAEYAEIKMIILGNPPKDGLEEIYQQLDTLTMEDLNCKVRFEFVPWGNEREQLNIAAASGEYDILPGGTFSDYKQQIAKNAFVDLNPYLYLVPEMVEHYALFSETALKDCEIDGALYGIPQFNASQRIYDNEGFFYREDLRKAWGLEEITDIESMEAYLYRAKEEQIYKDEPLITDNRIWQSLWILLGNKKYIEVGSMQETPLVVIDVNNPTEVINRLETPEFYEILQYIRKWKEDGILESDMLALSDNEGTRGMQLMLQNKKPCETNIPIWSVNATAIRELTTQHPEWEYDFFNYLSVREDIYKGNLTDSSVLLVSSKSKNIELAVQLIGKLHTEQEYYDLLHYGVEGIHYYLVGDKVSYEGISSDNRFSYSVAGDDLLNREEVAINEQFYNQAVAEIDEWRMQTEENTLLSPIATFSYSVADMENIDALKDAQLMYFQPLVCGYYDEVEENLSNTINKLYEAGLEEYMCELSLQIQKELNK